MKPTIAPPACLNPSAASRTDMAEWFRGAHYGLFIHYGLYSLLNRHEWVQLNERIPVADYAKLADDFSAERFDAQAIARLAVDAGMTYINLTTRHHESFCLWDTATTNFNSAQAPRCRRDLVAELADACQQHGLALCLYLSHGRDWRHPHAPNNDQYGGNARPAYDTPDPAYTTPPQHDLNQYLDDLLQQTQELLTNYGPIAAIWLDGIATPLHPKDPQGNTRQDHNPLTDGDPFRCQQLYDLVHQLQPWTMVSYKQGYLGTEDFFAPEHKAHSRFDLAGRPMEICSTMTPGSWGCHAELDKQHLDEQGVWAKLQDAAARHANLLLNTGPLPDGSLHPGQAAVLRAVGQRIATQGLPALP
ncbi:MAG: alpha-L-fucosidase [Planctomycetota bacterium]